MAFALEFLPARHGDCILLRWGLPERVMLVDGGPDGVYEQVLRPRLMALPHAPGGSPLVHVLCVSHVDDDHVVGVIRLLKDLVTAKNAGDPLPVRVGQLWFNSVDDLVESTQPGLATSVRALVAGAPADAATAASYSQGSEVRDRASALGLSGNPPFGGPLTVGLTTQLHGLDVTVVGPTDTALQKLTQKWRAAIDLKNPKVVADAFKDRAVPNLSSIALHLHHAPNGPTVLLTGDARGDHLLAGLETAGLLAAGAAMSVDVLKLPHHGSQNNAAPALFERIRADHYVVSADGLKHHHPDTATLEWLVGSRGDDERYTIHLTNPIPAAEATLHTLAQGRSFEVKVGAPRTEIVFD